MDDPERLRQLRWMCRRGMRELDVLLEAFVERQAGALAAHSWPEFESLLRREDDCIWDWLRNPAAVPDRAFRSILQEIRGGAALLD